MNSLRLKYGLFWRTKYPPIARPLFALLVVILLYALASTLDYYMMKAAEMEQVAENNRSLAQVTLNCMNGAVGFGWKDAGLIFECGRKL